LPIRRRLATCPTKSRANGGGLGYNLADMTPESAAVASTPPPAGMSEISRIAGVFFEPAKTFEDVAQRPAFIVPLVLVILFSLVYTGLYSQHVGWERMIRRQMETNTRAAQLPPEQRETQIQMGLKIAPIFGYAISLVGVPLGYLIAAAVLLAMVKIMSAPTRLSQVYAVLCYAGVTGIIFIVLAIAVMFLKNPDDFDIQNPLAFNLGALLDPNSGSKFVYTLATSMDLFSIWKIVLIAIGLKATGGRSLSFTGALFAVLIPWGIWVLCAAALAGVRG